MEMGVRDVVRVAIGLPAAALFGYLVFGDVPSNNIIIGAAAIITRGNAGPPGSYRWRNLPQALAEGPQE